MGAFGPILAPEAQQRGLRTDVCGWRERLSWAVVYVWSQPTDGFQWVLERWLVAKTDPRGNATRQVVGSLTVWAVQMLKCAQSREGGGSYLGSSGELMARYARHDPQEQRLGLALAS